MTAKEKEEAYIMICGLSEEQLKEFLAYLDQKLKEQEASQENT